jgi:ribonuclease R
VRFGEVFEGYVPVRRLGGDYYEIDELGTALAGRRTKRTFRLGDPIDVAVTDINRAEGKVEVRPAGSTLEGRRENRRK